MGCLEARESCAQCASGFNASSRREKASLAVPGVSCHREGPHSNDQAARPRGPGKAGFITEIRLNLDFWYKRFVALAIMLWCDCPHPCGPSLLLRLSQCRERSTTNNQCLSMAYVLPQIHILQKTRGLHEVEPRGTETVAGMGFSGLRCQRVSLWSEVAPCAPKRSSLSRIEALPTQRLSMLRDFPHRKSSSNFPDYLSRQQSTMLLTMASQSLLAACRTQCTPHTCQHTTEPQLTREQASGDQGGRGPARMGNSTP